MKRAPKNSAWNPDKWQERCAWCTRKIGEDEEAFGISIRLHEDAFKEFEPGTIQPLLLASAGKTVPMMVASLDSPAKREGKDAMFQICSEACGKALQTVLKTELDDREN